MKATYNQIEKALNNTFEFGIDGTEQLYVAIRNVAQKSELNVNIHKSSFNYTKSDWKKIHAEIKKLIA